MKDEKIPLGVEEVDALLEAGEEVHTLMQSGALLLGCDVGRKELLDYARIGGAELAGESASSMGHGVVVWQGKTPIFCATNKDALQAKNAALAVKH